MKEKIVLAAVKAAETEGYMNLMYKTVSEESGITISHIQYYFPKISILREAVVKYAVVHSHVPILAQALALKHEAIKDVDKITRGEVARYIKGV